MKMTTRMELRPLSELIPYARNAREHSEEQIRQLKDSLWKTDDQIDEMEDNLGDLRDAGGALAAAKEQAQAGVDQAVAAYAAMEERLRPQIDAVEKKDTRDRG